VGDGVAEGLELPIGILELGGALGHPLFERLVQVADLFLGLLALGDVDADPAK
jgi:hypothetical protein